MPVAGPWYFAWVDEGTAFDATVHNRMDEYVFSLKRVLQEGNKPTLEMVIRNPHIGLLNTARKQWAWLSRHDGSTAGIVPVFYGRLLAAPKDIFKEVMTINLIAWPLDYVAQRQKLAEQIKDEGPYDPVFIEVSKRDDPDTLLEAISGLYHVDPVTHVVTISDILNGEDGNIDIDADQHFYDGMNAEFDQTHSLTAILMDATVTWNQTGQGFIDMGAKSIATYAGDNVISEWPKPLQQLGGGYTVQVANAYDAAGVNAILTASATVTYTNREKEHSDGDCLSYSDSVTQPVGGGPMESVLATMVNQTGILDPFATDGNGDPSPTNIPPKLSASWIYCPAWVVTTTLALTYRDLERQRTERVQMLLQSDLQPIIVRPEVEQNSEIISKTGTDVGVPIIHLLNWTTVAGAHVDVDTIVFPNNPTLPSQRTAQVCVVAGTAGLVEPTFSDIAGITTTDGGVTWASLGTAAPTETAFDWPANTPVGLGTMILPRRQLSVPTALYILGGAQQIPPQSTHIGVGVMLDNNRICTTSGLIGPNGNSAVFVNVQNPDGKTHYICVQAGLTGPQFNIPFFDNTLHARTTDNGVIWAAIGPGDIPAGGTPGDVWARSYFDTTRGLNSVEYLISIMRARARLKARAVTVDFEPIDPFGLGMSLTLRKTVTLHDTRLGGGVVTGKLIHVEHTCDGDSGREECHAQIGCAIGKDNTISTVAGTPTYADEDYCDPDYQYYSGKTVVVSEASDVGYTVPVFAPNDDGLTFPLDKAQITISEGILGSFAAQGGAVGAALGAMAQIARLGQITPTSLDFSAQQQMKARALSGLTVTNATAANPIWYDAALKPLTGWQFNNFFQIKLTKFTCQKGIDLEGASTP